jgi:hypothetical protein
MANDVVFRRVGGRVIPIGRKREIKKGAAEIGAGVAIGAGAGYGAGKMVKHAQELAAKAKDHYRTAKQNYRAANAHVFGVKIGSFESFRKPNVSPRTVKLLGDDVKKAVANRMWAKKLFRARNPILHAGALGAAALIGHGVNRIRDASSAKKKTNGAVGQAVGIGAGIATYGAYYRTLGFKQPVHIATNIYARLKGLKDRPFKRYGRGGEI